MKVATTTAFTLDPTLPWLFSDPKMQKPSAFHGMHVVTMHEEPWAPMGLYFPASSQLALRRVTHLDQLTVGAAYWSEMDYYEPSKNEVRTSHSFGRYVGPESPESASTRRRWKRGEAHITLEADVLDCDLRSYFFREDGTIARFVDTNGHAHRLFEVTHYVNLPAQQLADLGAEAIKQTGLTLRQAVWLEQEKLISKASKGGWEITASTTGGCEYRVVLPESQALSDCMEYWSGLIPYILTARQAAKCKEETVAITTRTVTHSGLPYGDTEYYKVADVASLLEWLHLHSEVQRLKVEAAVCAQQMGHRAEARRAERTAYIAQCQADEANQAAAQKQGTPQGLRPDYASLADLAHAA